jgi:hypothetical protein
VKAATTSARIILARERERKALDLRLTGKTYEVIGAELGVAAPSAYKAVKRGIARIEKQTAESAREMIRLELERLDAMHDALWPRVLRGDEKAVESALHILEQRAKLVGLYAPTKIAPTDPSGTESYAGLGDAELEREIAAAVAGLGLGAQAPVEPARASPADPAAG